MVELTSSDEYNASCPVRYVESNDRFRLFNHLFSTRLIPPLNLIFMLLIQYTVSPPHSSNAKVPKLNSVKTFPILLRGALEFIQWRIAGWTTGVTNLASIGNPRL